MKKCTAVLCTAITLIPFVSLKKKLFDFIVLLISQSFCAAIKQLIPIFQGKFLGANCYNRHEPIVKGRIDIFQPFCRDKAVAREYKQRRFVHKFFASLRILSKIQGLQSLQLCGLAFRIAKLNYGGEGSFEAPLYNTWKL